MKSHTLAIISTLAVLAATAPAGPRAAPACNLFCPEGMRCVSFPSDGVGIEMCYKPLHCGGSYHIECIDGEVCIDDAGTECDPNSDTNCTGTCKPQPS